MPAKSDPTTWNFSQVLYKHDLNLSLPIQNILLKYKVVHIKQIWFRSYLGVFWLYIEREYRERWEMRGRK